MYKKQLIVAWVAIFLFCFFWTSAFAKNTIRYTNKLYLTSAGDFTQLSANFGSASFSMRSNTGEVSAPLANFNNPSAEFRKKSFRIVSRKREFSRNSFTIAPPKKQFPNLSLLLSKKRGEFSKPSFSLASNRGEFSRNSFTIASKNKSIETAQDNTR